MFQWVPGWEAEVREDNGEKHQRAKRQQYEVD